MVELSDAELVSRTRAGDNDAYRELVARYQGHVYGLAYSVLDNWADAQDMAQEAFIRAYCNLDQLRDAGRFAAWLRRVTFSVTMNWLKTFRPGLFEELGSPDDLDSLEIPDFAPGPPEVAEKRDLADAVLQAVASLPPKYRVPLTMFHLDGLSYQKVADFLDIPMGTVQSLIHRAREKLRPALAAYGGEGVSSMVKEVFDEHKLPPDFISKVWETCVLDATGEYVFDDEVKAVNAMMRDIDEFPEWALQVRDAMPKYGLEMCSHRWLDGLDDVLSMIGAEEHFPSSAGHCGDIPGRIVAAAERRAQAAQSWIEGRAPQNDLCTQVAEWLGEQTPEKKEAATCFVELVRGFFFDDRPNDEALQLAKQWRTRADANRSLKTLFSSGEGLDFLLQNRCGFKMIDRLDIAIRVIGGDDSESADLVGACIDQIRFVPRDDPARFDTTRGYLWGLDAYLRGRGQEWLRANKPECAGAAIYALQGVSRAGPPTPLRRWLVASLLKSTKIWCQALLNATARYDVALPAYALDLPDVVTAIEG